VFFKKSEIFCFSTMRWVVVVILNTICFERLPEKPQNKKKGRINCYCTFMFLPKNSGKSEIGR